MTRYRTVTKWRTGWGNYVVIRHLLPNGQTVHSLYGHLKPKSVLVERGDIVAAGQPIALVGNTGRASSPHLHLEIRKSLPAELAEDGLDPEDVEDATVEDRSFALLQTVDPISFLEQHVRHFDDLENDSWQAAYALAACRDGVLAGDGDEFDPNESITRADFYRALAAVFRPGMGASRPSFAAAHRSLAQAGIVDTLSGGTDRAGDTLTRSEALELLLRCLDKSPARGRSLAAFERDGLCRDFNRVFAGPEAAARAERQARATAAARTRSERKAADMEFEKALLAAKAKGAGATVRKRVKRRVVKPIEPVLGVEEGFAALAQSKRNLTRAEACLLLASAFRPGGDRASALEQAAARVPSPTSG